MKVSQVKEGLRKGDGHIRAGKSWIGRIAAHINDEE